MTDVRYPDRSVLVVIAGLPALIDPGNGGSTSFRNVGELLPDYVASHVRQYYTKKYIK
jgi:hypothetical protein